MADINFKYDTPEIGALRAIKPLVIEIQTREEISFTAALNKAVKELGYINYAIYRLDSMSASIVQRHI